MKQLSEYLRENLFCTPSDTIGMGEVTSPTDTSTGSEDLPAQCIDIKTGKTYKRRKKFRRYKI